MMGNDELSTSIKAKLQPSQSAVSPETCVTAHRLEMYVAKSERSLMMCPLQFRERLKVKLVDSTYAS
eukprot:8374112-Ditylum_brightwellii.AAC.1